MTSTVLVPPLAAGAADEVADEVLAGEVLADEVLGLGAAGTLRFVLERRRRQDAAAAEELLAVAHWADLHRVRHVGAVHSDIARTLDQEATALGLEGELRLAGQGAFGVCEFAVAELATGLGMSEAAGRAYVGQALELRDRLPRCFHRVVAGDLPAWKARRIAEQTVPLTAEAAAWVDGQLAPFAARISLARVLRAVDAAVLRFDPEEADRRAVAAAERRGVWLEDRIDGTTAVNAVTSTPDAWAFDAALDEVATSLRRLGDPDPEQVRRAKAVGVLADPQYALALTGPDTAEDLGEAAGTGGPVLHVHVHVDAVEGPGDDGATGLVARLSGGREPGARAVETVRRWISELRPGATVGVTPVVDLTEHVSVDSYEVPARLRRQVEHRDLTCRFPWCPRTGRFDVDHIEAYRFEDPDDPDGRPPPGQTNTANTARLCRFHHRVKTRGGWGYHRDHDTSVTWTSPLGRRYAVDETGTRPLG